MMTDDPHARNIEDRLIDALHCLASCDASLHLVGYDGLNYHACPSKTRNVTVTSYGHVMYLGSYIYVEYL